MCVGHLGIWGSTFSFHTLPFEHVLIRLHRILGERLRLCNLPFLVMEHFEVNRLATLFHIYSTRKVALQSTGQPSQSTEPPSGNDQ